LLAVSLGVRERPASTEREQLMEIPVGARVTVTAGDGVVRWTGLNPPFAAGKWVGVEL
jgi:hypothetical protein